MSADPISLNRISQDVEIAMTSDCQITFTTVSRYRLSSGGVSSNHLPVTLSRAKAQQVVKNLQAALDATETLADRD